MQQTEKYNFNLIDADDPFSPEPLNKNMETLETELVRVDAALDTKAEQTEVARVESETAAALNAETDAREAEIARVERGQLVYATGTYKGNGKGGPSAAARLEFDFRPLVVWVCDTGDVNHGYYPWIRDQNRSRVGNGYYVTLTWEEQAVSWYGINGAEYQLTGSGTTYRYFALGIPV